MEKRDLMRFLMRQESPFSWEIPEIADHSHDQYIDNQIEKFQNLEEENEFQWTRFTLSLLLSYELSDKRKDHSRALGYTNLCKDHLLTLKKSRCHEPLFSSLYPTLLFVTCVTEAIILLRSGEVGKAIEVIEGWPFTACASPTTPSPGLLGLKAALYLQYGTLGQRMALSAAKEARDLDPDQGEWWFLIGNALGRLRRTENGPITELEISAIEKAFALERNASYTVHLAQLYSEYSSYWYYNQNQEKAKKYAKAAVSRYREAISLRPNCMLLKARVAHGMLRIRDREARDIPFAKKLLDEVVKSTPSNSMVYHDLGYYHEKFGRNTKEALVCLSESNKLGNIKALIYMINLKWKYGKKFEMIGDLAEGLTRYKSLESQAQLLVCLGACHALVKGDWKSAVECFQQSLQVDPSAKYLEKFQGFDDRHVNLLEVVTNHLHQESSEKFKSFLDSVNNIRPNIIHPAGTKKSYREWKKDMLKVNKKISHQNLLRVCRVQPQPIKSKDVRK